MALSSAKYQDDNDNWVYEVDGKQVDVWTYNLQTGEAKKLYDDRIAAGWPEDEANQSVAQEYDPNYFADDWPLAEDVYADPVTGAPIGQTEYEEKVARLEAEAQYQEAVNAAQNVADKENDWRVRLHLAPEAKYLYQHPTDPGILAPLQATKGIIFPYTPEISVQYNANYENYDLTHSNYRGYFYTGSVVQNLLVNAVFTANDVAEANYLLASMHFLRSATKMFYGQDQNRGMPPPVVFLTGLGEYQFNNHPCAITMMNYNLPNDVDYIPCGKPEGVAPIAVPKPVTGSTSASRLGATSELGPGGKFKPPVNDATDQGSPNTYNKATYVPTKINITFTMIPIQTRDQVSKEFSLEDYASGKLLNRGFW